MTDSRLKQKSKYVKAKYKVKQTPGDIIFHSLNAILMLFLVVVMLYPMLNTLAISFNEPLDSVRGGIYLWPRIFSLAAYEAVFENELLLVAFRNSIARTIISTIGGLFVCSVAAYVLSRREFLLRKFVTIYFVVTMYVAAGLIPTFFLFQDLGILNTFHVYWLPGLFGAFNVIVIRSYMQGLPDSLVEAARIDGAGEFRIFLQVILPICKPVLATVGLWLAVGSWNDWFTTEVFARQNQLATLQHELMKLVASAMSEVDTPNNIPGEGQLGGHIMTPIAMRAAITMVATIPILCVYPFLQKYFVKGVHVGSVKG
ncbi:MAG: carbohydrate ABC transporter permease [Oscillospiraceae bacterium]|jgi:putative aldouronate transport system permease protein|nr:carbohydrate ABC transporter permease [Oscillospiraceae bacterium]